MMIRLFAYFSRRACLNIRGALLINILSLLTVAFVMLILSGFLLASLNVGRFLSVQEKSVAVSVYLRRDMSPARQDELNRVLSSRPGVTRLEFISTQKALERFLEWNRKMKDVVDRLDENPFPASFELSIDPAVVSPSRLKEFSEEIGRYAGVEGVDYSREWFEKLTTFVKAMKGIGLFMALFLSVACAFVIYNTIRLNVHSKRDEIRIMDMVGATPMFIRVPFIMEGLFESVVGTLLALGVLYVGFEFYLPDLEASFAFVLGGGGFEFLKTSHLVLITGLGGFVGLFGSTLAVRRFLRSEL